MPGGFRRKRAREDRRVRVDANGLRREVVGDAGLGAGELDTLLATLDAHADQLERQRRVGWAAPAASRTDLRHVRRLRDEVGGTATDVVLLASPEIALGVRALASALVPSEPVAPATRSRLHVFDGPDPVRFAALVDTLDWARTLVIVASIGEADLATTAHFLVVRDRLLRELGAVEYQRHVVVVTAPGDVALGQIVHDEGFRSLACADGNDPHGGILGAAGLLPLACIGVDVATLAAGGAGMLERRRESDGRRPAHLLALALCAAAPVAVRVAPPAAAGLRELAAWMERTLALAIPVDSGARTGRLVTLRLDATPHGDGLDVPKTYQDLESIGCVGGLDLAVLAAHEHAADELARWAGGELTVSITLPDASPDAVGQLVALTEAAAVLARPTAATTVPARARRLAFGLVGRAGFEAERAAAERLTALREERWVA